MRCQLSGLPELKLGINEEALNKTTNSSSINFEDIKFHSCVRLAKFENERIITFVPPDGDF